MKISDIKTYPINIGSGSQLVVKVETDSGIYGWGASGLSGRELAVIGAITHFKGFLIGKDPHKIEAIWQELYRGQYFEGGRVLAAAISAIDIALYDIKGKTLGVPVYELLGGKQRNFVPCFASVRFTTLKELLDYSNTCIKEGWKVLRLAPAEFESQKDKSRFEPTESITLLADWVTELRHQVGRGITIGIDYHTRLTAAETYSFIKRMPAGTLDFIEEPIRDENPEAYESLRKMVDVPFTIGEEFSSKWQFLPFLEKNIAQYARVDVCNVGGITEAMKVAAIAEAHYIDLMPHNPLGPICTAASIHMAAACSNFSYLEEINTPAQQMGTNDRNFYPVQPELDGTGYQVPDTSGLGVEFDEKYALNQEFKPVEIPRLKRDDGSFTNW
ncbi:mandelate racemase/muconate lactonizing enzyme family protein [Ulvibacterium marinum]|uniref:mandelate racemase/muconate lactonizing enzyme family protein n=1 Tax=Ulvibacterium marinum TaxID=2419782 RepID=UPI002494E53C|nr:mandelate racemase/muconate lactonizing enzyme family protein [Ulvibacterium marinum]